MPQWQKIAVIASAAVVVVGAGGFGAYSLLGSGADDSPAAKKPPEVKTGPPSAAEVRATAKDFLAAWEGGKEKTAARLTDDSAAALAGMASFQKDAYVSQVNFKAGKRAGASMPFTVTAKVDFGEKTSTWTYESALEVVREKKTGKPQVDWKPTVLHPDLGEGERLRTGEAKTPPIKAMDRNNKPLTTKDYPSLGPVLDSLREKYGKTAGGSAGVEVWIEAVKEKEKDKKDDEKAAAPQTLLVLSKGTSGTVKTTLDAAVQKSAEETVAKAGKSSLVALKPSTGEILAVANYPGDGFNTALQGSMAPGSTMKVVTASLLIDKGLASTAEEHPCPQYSAYGGWKFQNVEEFELPKGSTFAQSFANSCNTAFISQAEKLKNDDLTKQSRDVFGLGLNWNTGVSTFDGRVPVQENAQMAASLIGQGGVRANPLVMASVSATVKSGGFKQPYLISPEVDGRTLASTPGPMKASTAQELRGLMKQTAQWGTAAKAMSGLSGDVGAKTGSAEVDGQKKPNAWFTAYRNDLAVAAVVPASGHGGDFAGPLVKAMLAAHG